MERQKGLGLLLLTVRGTEATWRGRRDVSSPVRGTAATVRRALRSIATPWGCRKVADDPEPSSDDFRRRLRPTAIRDNPDVRPAEPDRRDLRRKLPSAAGFDAFFVTQLKSSGPCE